jgi:hypothetical protein
VPALSRSTYSALRRCHDAIKGGTLKVRDGRAAIKLSCPATSRGNCRGTLSLRTAGRVRFAGLSAVLRLGSAHFNIATGATKTVTVKLAKGTGRLADRNGRLRVVAVVTTGSAASSSRRATLALSKSSAGRPSPQA